MQLVLICAGLSHSVVYRTSCADATSVVGLYINVYVSFFFVVVVYLPSGVHIIECVYTYRV